MTKSEMPEKNVPRFDIGTVAAVLAALALMVVTAFLYHEYLGDMFQVASGSGRSIR